MPSESLNDDVKRIRDFYARVTAKYPELFTNIELRPVTV
jgi:hypothetical protein